MHSRRQIGDKLGSSYSLIQGRVSHLDLPSIVGTKCPLESNDLKSTTESQTTQRSFLTCLTPPRRCCKCKTITECALFPYFLGDHGNMASLEKDSTLQIEHHTTLLEATLLVGARGKAN